MSRVLRTMTLRGQITPGTSSRIMMDRMDPTLAWRVIEFRVCSGLAQGYDDITGTLTTEEPGLATWAVPGTWNMADNRQIGWANNFTHVSIGVGNSEFSLVDEDNLVVEDLFVVAYSRTGDSGLMNYYIRAELQSVTMTQNLYGMVRSKSQDV